MDRTQNTFLLKIIAISCLAIFLTGTLFLAGCSEVLAKKEPTMISAEKVAEILKTQKDSYVILDVRTKEEFDSGHLESAVLIPVDELETRYGELSKDKPIIVYCRSGNRSAKAAALLISKGFSQVYDMTGGINAWTSKGYPVIVESASTTMSNEASNESQAPQNTTSAATAATDNTDITEVKYITSDELNTKVTKGEDIIILDVRSEDSLYGKAYKRCSKHTITGILRAGWVNWTAQRRL